MNSIYPESGRVMYRTVGDAMAVVGVVKFPAEFTPREGGVYILTKGNGTVAILGNAVSDETPDHLALNNVDGQLANKIWPMPLAQEDIPVRFISAFPQDNIWTMYGLSPHQAKDVDDNKWEDIHSGKTTVIPLPPDAHGMTMGQALTEIAAWPGPGGELYSVPQTTTKWRERFLRYHLLLAEGGRSHQPAREITAKVKYNPQLADLAERRIDPAYCRFLAELVKMGVDLEDRPMNKAQLFKRKQLSRVAVAASLGKRPGLRASRR